MSEKKNELLELRHELHQNPEVSGREKETPGRLLKFIRQYKPTQVIEGLGGHGLAFIYKFDKEGPVVMFRAELDALPIQEINDKLSYTSDYEGTGHMCGHDGHMAILAGLAEKIHEEPLERGTVILLFQPAEENGEGAVAVLNDEKFEKIEPDYIFALHNLPGFPEKQVILKNKVFAAASKGMVIKLMGQTSHAAEPEKGNNPALPMAAIIQKLEGLPKDDIYEGKVLVTVIHAVLGEIAFGTTPGYAEVRATLRAWNEDDLEMLSNVAQKEVEQIAHAAKLETEILWQETFAPTTNHPEAFKILKKAVQSTNHNYQEVNKAFGWSEDFGAFTKKYKGAYFGVGAGEDHPSLHNPDYDFPDDLIPVGVDVFYQIARQLLK